MRYIHKEKEPIFITEYKKIQSEVGLTATYSNFKDKEKLNEILRIEQHHLCCYCQQALNHYQRQPLQGGAHNEHLIPQWKDPGDGSIDMDYYNIYACCIDSRGTAKRQQHCGEAKGNKLIKGLIKSVDCHKYFKYNSLGEILPNGIYDKWQDYVDNSSRLSGAVKDSYDEISDLNLNCEYLVSERKGDALVIFKGLNKLSKNEILKRIYMLENIDKKPRFVDMQLYFMYQKIYY